MEEFTALASGEYEDLHVTRAAGVLVAVSGGRTALMEALPPHPCQLARRMDAAAVSSYIHRKVRKWGMFTPGRRLRHHATSVPFGASEMLMRAVRRGGLDGAVAFCDGIGTFACPDPEVIQGTGARMNGVFHTTIYPDLVMRARSVGVLVPERPSPKPDPARALRLSAEAGIRRVGVTVAGPGCGDIEDLRKISGNLGLKPVVLSVCNSGLSSGESMAAAKADIIWGCAAEPRLMSELRGKVLLQMGVVSPVFALTEAGVSLALASISGQTRDLHADGGTLVGTARELPDGAPLGSVGPLRVAADEGRRLPWPMANGGTVGV